MADRLCREVEGDLAEYALGAGGSLRPEASERVASHLAICPTCRETFARYEAMTASLPGALRLARTEVPEAVLAESRERFEARLRDRFTRLRAAEAGDASEAEAPGENRGAGVARSPLSHSFVRWMAAAAVLAVAVLLAGRWERKAERSSSPVRLLPPPPVMMATRPPKRDSSVEGGTPPSPLEARFAALTGADEAMALLRSAFEAERGKTAPVLAPLLDLSTRLAATWPDSREAVEALRLVSRIHTERACPEAAREAFLAYAEASGAAWGRRARRTGASAEAAEAAGRRRVSEVVRREIERLLEVKDPLQTLAYCDAVRTRWPGTETARHAEYMTGKLYARMGERGEAIRVLEDLVTGEEDRWATRAFLDLSRLYANTGRPEKGIEALWMFARCTGTRQAEAMALCSEGGMRQALGEAHAPRAATCFRRVIDAYSDQANYVKAAREGLGRMERDLLDAMADDVLGM